MHLHRHGRLDVLVCYPAPLVPHGMGGPQQSSSSAYDLSAPLSLVCMTPVRCRIPLMGAKLVTVTVTATSENGSNYWPLSHLTCLRPNTRILLALLPYAPKWVPTWKSLFLPAPLVNPQTHLVNHLEERLLVQAQARASYTHLLWGPSRSIPQCMVSNVQPPVKSSF